ncbi:uncharacterized protein LOC122291729 isoform X1 [Carya illinoinensis]|uniref:Protein EARLY FLOWERING 4 domain-containing protein n=1 Tax=Carya illinoinensis TaxID=32201 RepID=A0A8T1NNW4_CARIL|nr:uncharacterized protein LOC122291729 isoform X1 [Carya illinoinensis]KAG6631232.1 hypothetical protein CIPAW_13G077400 [Carya illinoinensis]
MHVGGGLKGSLVVESTMDDTTTVTKPWSRHTVAKSNKKERSEENEMVEDEDEEECDMEVWETLSQSFFQVQSALDQNRTLIQQVNENHQSRIPDNLAKNVELIREINCNISKVLSIYSDLSVNFSSIVRQRRAIMSSRNDTNSSVHGKEERRRLRDCSSTYTRARRRIECFAGAERRMGVYIDISTNVPNTLHSGVIELEDLSYVRY